MLLTKGEKGLGAVDLAVAGELLAELAEQLGKAVEMRESLASGYVRKGFCYIAIYNGRFGRGITVRWNNENSTRYCKKWTCIWNAEESEIEEIVEAVCRRDGVERCRATF